MQLCYWLSCDIACVIEGKKTHVLDYRDLGVAFYLINKSMNIGFQSNSGVKARKQAIVRREIIIALLKAPFNVTTPCIREVILITDFWDLKH